MNITFTSIKMKYSKYLYVLLLCFSSVKNLCGSFINENKKPNFIQMNLIQVPTIDTEKEFSVPEVPGGNWIATALKDIAYFLRNHKFNDWDRRYYKEQPTHDYVGFYKEFPNRPLKLLHWKVLENCYKSFYECIIYLQSVINIVPFRRTDDITTKFNKNVITINDSTVRKLNNECKDALLYSDKTGAPFDGPKEKFQWRVSASYFMCWYTMLEMPALSMLEERCDNFANCLDPINGVRNRDPRADDRQSFICAMYSFCPDPCCPIKYVKEITQCYENIDTPCFFGKQNANTTCKLDRKKNQNFEDMIQNKWNTSCYCEDKGFVWKSKFGICVDINECLNGNNNCDNESEECLNLPGTFKCICKWSFYFNNATKSCVKI